MVVMVIMVMMRDEHIETAEKRGKKREKEKDRGRLTWQALTAASRRRMRWEPACPIDSQSPSLVVVVVVIMW
jgi:hypothetical protein